MHKADGPAARAGRSVWCGIGLAALLMLQLDWTATAAAKDSSDVALDESAGILSELRAGLSVHDVGLFGSHKEKGLDFELEVLFDSPWLLEPVFAPRPLIGGIVNSAGDTNQLYGGLAWTWSFAPPLFAELGLDLALHDGELEKRPGAKGLGCRLLFRESLSLGLRFGGRHSLMATVAHISNAGLCDPNEGLDTVGLRYGLRF